MLRIGIDIDGVLSNFTKAFNKKVNEIWPGRIPFDFEPTEWDMSSSGLSVEEISRVWDRIKTTENFWQRQAPYLDNIEALHKFLNKTNLNKVTVYYITSRVPTLGSSVLVQTQRWLSSWYLIRPNTSVLATVTPEGSTTPPKSLIVEALGIHAHIDDYLPTIKSIGVKGVLLRRPWNISAVWPVDLKAVGTLQSFLDSLQP